MMKILVIDDHALFRDGLILVLNGLNADTKIFEAGSFEPANDIIDTHSDLGLILLDLGLAEISHLDALPVIRLQTGC